MSESDPERAGDPLEEMREQLASVSAGDVVAEACLSLVALAYVRLGVPPEQHERYRDLDAARLLIDALGGMLEAVKGRLGAAEPSLRDALAGLRMAYADVAAHLQAGHPPGGAPAPGPEPQPPGPGVQRPSGLWVPGQD
jgi:hypothetical protein